MLQNLFRRSHHNFVLGAVLIVLAGCSQKDDKAAAAGPAPSVPVSIATVAQKDMPVVIRAIGNVQAIETVGIKSQITGEIMEVHFKEGQDVNKGDLLFEIDPRQSKADLAKAESTLLKDQAAANNARAQAERYTKLSQEGVVSKEQYDTFMSGADAAEAAVAADKAAVEYARLQLLYTKIYSPVTGRTGGVTVKRGNVVKANETPVLVTINQITPIYLEFAVPEQQLPDVKRYMHSGLHVEAMVQGENHVVQPVRGELTFIDNEVDSSTGTIKLRGTFPNADRRLWPGQFADVVLTLTSTPNAIVVPSQAIQTGQNGQYVFVVNADMTADMRLVTVNRTLGNESVIASGLQPGERVVTDGQLRLNKGAKVEIKQSANPSASHTASAD